MVDVAIKALGRNRLQTGLTMLGITVGVATVLAMMAVGAGAQRSIEQQVRAAGLNQLTIRAGNWRPKLDDSDEAIAHQGDARDVACSAPCSGSAPRRRGPDRVSSGRRSDGEARSSDARQRLGDLEAGLGSAATMTFADAEAIRKMAGVQYVAGGIHENARVALRQADKRWFTRMHGTDVMMPSIKRAWTFTGGRFFSEREQDRADQVIVLGQVVVDRLFGAGVNPVGQDRHAVEPAIRGRRRRHERDVGRAARARRRSVRRRLHAVHDDAAAAESVEAERHHGDRRIVRRCVAAVA